MMIRANRPITTVLSVLALALSVTAAHAGDGWLTSYEEALAKAKETGKPVLTDFTGSDWCGWCIRLKKEVFDTDAFKTWAGENVILLELDYPQAKPQTAAMKEANKALLEKYGVTGFPTILFLDAQGQVLAKSGYKAGGAEAWIADAQSLLAPKPALTEEGWFISYEEAVKQSKATGKPIMTNFTGSDWCGWCIRLKDEVFSKDEFKAWAKENVVLLELDFPRAKKLDPAIAAQNKELGAKYAVRGYPTILFLGADGEVLGKSGYREGGPVAWTANASELIAAYKPAEGDAAPAADAGGYPPAPKKNLYAKNDLRGQAAPALAVEQWLTAQPSTQGKVVLIDFWATWCGPCRKAIPELNQFQQAFKDDLVIIGISDEPAEKVKAFMETTPIEYAMAIDTAKAMSEQVGVQGIPHALVISTDGIVRWQGFPNSQDDPLTEAVLRRIIDADKAARQTQAKAE